MDIEVYMDVSNAVESIFGILRSAESAIAETSENRGRTTYTVRGVVTSVDDPEKSRRIKVALASKGGQLESHWCRRAVDTPYYDPPLPSVGMTVVVTAIEGNPHDLVWHSAQVNDANAPLEKESPENDFREDIPGSVTTNAGENLKLFAQKTIRIENEKGAYIELNKDGTVTISDAFGHKLILGENTSPSVERL